jgi:hypothetical protein
VGSRTRRCPKRKGLCRGTDAEVGKRILSILCSLLSAVFFCLKPIAKSSPVSRLKAAPTFSFSQLPNFFFPGFLIQELPTSSPSYLLTFSPSYLLFFRLPTSHFKIFPLPALPTFSPSHLLTFFFPPSASLAAP